MNRCSKPGCSGLGAVVLGYDYAARAVVLEDPAEIDITPHLYVLCSRCADALVPPRGWDLHDQRSSPVLWAGAP